MVGSANGVPPWPTDLESPAPPLCACKGICAGGNKTMPGLWHGGVDALCECRFYTVIPLALGQYWPQGEQGVSVLDIFTLLFVETSLSTILGLMVWLARKSFWKLRWVVKEGASLWLDLLLLVWTSVLSRWVTDFCESENGVRQFLLAWCLFLETGVLPRLHGE